MSNGVGVPPDIAAQMKQQGARGIGGGAVENSMTAHQRGAAMNIAPEKEFEPPASKAEVPESVELKNCPNSKCSMELESEWNFCPKCNTDLIGGDAAKRLGITFEEQDVSDYLFKGYIVRDVKILGSHKVTMKSPQPKDFEAIDNYIMNGKWGKEPDGSDRKISDFYMRQMNAICMTAAAVMKIDGEPIGSTLEERVDWLQGRGSLFVDHLSQKATLFSQAIADFLKKEDTVLGS